MYKQPSSIRRAARLLLAAGFLACAAAARAAEPRPAQVIADFEKASDRGFVRARKPAVISAKVSSHGGHSLKLRADDYINFETGRLGRRAAVDTLLKVDLFNACTAPVPVRIEMFDATARKGYWYRHVRRYVLRRGWNTLSFPVARLYRGEKNSRRIRDAYLDPARIHRVDMAFSGGDGAVYLDYVRFEPDPPMPAVEGLRAFDFGPPNQAARHDFTACSREVYTAQRGHGWSSPGWKRACRDYIHPNNLLADFREAAGETFSVDVPPGNYRVRVYYEDHGWWEDQFARFRWRTIRAEGRVVYEERLDRAAAAKRFYRFADMEPGPDTDVYDVYVRNGRYKPKAFDVTVKDGRLDVRFDADRSMVSRVAALVLWPARQAKPAARWCAELDRRMEEQFRAENVYVPSAPRGRSIPDLPRSARDEALLVFSAGGTAPTGPDYVPARDELLARIDLFCVPGEDTGATFSLRPTRAGGPLEMEVALKGLQTQLRLVQNRLQRRGGGYTIVPDILRPAGELRIETGRTRQFWLEIRVPPDTRPGTYKGAVTARLGQDTKTAPVSVEVLDIRLADPQMAFGLFGLMPDSYAPPNALERVIDLLRRHGLSSVAGVPLGRAHAEEGRLRVDFTTADKVMGALKDAGFRLPVDTYGGGGLSGVAAAARDLRQDRADVFREAMTEVGRHAKADGWPPVSYAMVDEPHWSDDAVAKAAERVTQVNAAAPWVLTNGYWSPDAGKAVHRRLMNVLGRTTLGRVTPEAVAWLRSKGKSIGFYGGCSRHEFGLKQWAAAREGFGAHFAWHFYVRYGDLYYDLDAREPDVCMVYYTPTEVRPSLRLKDVRAGAYDFRYLRTLAEARKGRAADPAAPAAETLLATAAAAGNLYRRTSAPALRDRDAFRRRVAEMILQLHRGAER
jgi:hypothetical protein